MIIESMLNAIYNILFGVIDLLPVIEDFPSWIDNTLNLLSYGLMFFPVDVFITFLGSVGFWMGAHMLWAIIEWVYKKIPGVD